LAAALALGACGDDDDDDGGLRSAGDFDTGSDSVSQYAAATPAPPLSGANPVAGSTGDEPLPQAAESGRKIIFTANISLDARDVGGAYSEAVSLARANGGYVEKSQFSNDTEDNTRRSASLSIRVPVQNYDSLVASLRTMSGVSVDTEGSNSSEVTEQYTDLQSRLRNLERTEQQYLLLLEKASSIPDILTVQDRLSGIRSQIEQIQGRLKVLDDLTDFATVNVSIAPLAAAVQEPKSEGWKLSEVLGESWEASLEVARYVAAAGLVLLVAVAWLGVPAALIYFAARRVRRRPDSTAPLAESS